MHTNDLAEIQIAIGIKKMKFQNRKAVAEQCGLIPN